MTLSFAQRLLCLWALCAVAGIAFRKKLYRSVQDLQPDLDAWLLRYNKERFHSETHCNSKTEMQTVRETRHIAVERTIKTHEPSDSAHTSLSVARQGFCQNKSEGIQFIG